MASARRTRAIRLSRKPYWILPVNKKEMENLQEFGVLQHSEPPALGGVNFFHRYIYYRYDIGGFWNKVSTLIHEVVHVAFRNLRSRIKFRISHDNEEEFCNEVANLIVCWLRQWHWFRKKDIA